MRLSSGRAGFAVGITCAVFYLACMLLMQVAPPDFVVRLFSMLAHGLDLAPMMRWDIPWWESVVGVAATFALGWVFGALVAVFYNIGMPKGTM